MDAGGSPLFPNSPIEPLFPRFCRRITSWSDCGHLDDAETSDTHVLGQSNGPLPSYNASETARCIFCDKPFPATSMRDDLKTLYFGRKLSHCVRRTRLSHLGLNDRYLRASYCECQNGASIDPNDRIEDTPGTGSSVHGGSGYEPDLDAIATKAPQKLFNSYIPLPASKKALKKKHPTTLWLPDSVSTRLWESGHILPLSERINQGRTDIRELLRIFDKDLPPFWDSDRGAMLPDVMVIDCCSRRVVAAQPGCHYVALSYVWGSNRSRDVDESFQQDLHGRRLPQVVQDAMKVVRMLGMQFLWVDRYCINNTEPATKYYMISNMDAIYEAAYLTIIAASGSDDEYGLPSVSKSHKELEGGFVPPWSSVYHRHHKQIEQSAWSKRGWTYQEGLLSRRRLIFTDVCVTLHYRGNDRVSSSSGIFFHINEYSKRSLTYTSDMLNAFLGVLRAYERSWPPAMHVWGVPFLLDSDGNIGQPGYGLLWRGDLGYSLRRIQGLPSWTWAGWNGWSSHDEADKYPHDDWSDGFIRGSFEPGPYKWLLEIAHMRLQTRPWGPSDISLEILTGEHLIDISDYFRASQQLPFGIIGKLAPILYLTAWSTTVTGYVLPEFSVYLEGGDMGIGHATFDPSVESLCKPESQVNRCWSCEWAAAVICWNVSNEHARGLQTQSLLLERVGEDTFRRVGILETDWRKSDMDEHGHMAAFARTFTRTRLRIA